MTDRADERPLAGLLKRIVEECPSPARLIELYYWSAERELAEVMRQFIALPPEARAAFHGFLMLVKNDPGSVTTEITENGELTFSAPVVMELAKKMADPDAPPPFLN